MASFFKSTSCRSKVWRTKSRWCSAFSSCACNSSSLIRTNKSPFFTVIPSSKWIALTIPDTSVVTETSSSGIKVPADLMEVSIVEVSNFTTVTGNAVNLFICWGFSEEVFLNQPALYITKNATINKVKPIWSTRFCCLFIYSTIWFLLSILMSTNNKTVKNGKSLMVERLK